MKMNKINVGIGAFFVLFGIFILIVTPIFVTAVSSTTNGMVPTSFPNFVGWLSIVLGALEVVDALIGIKNKRDDEEFEERDKIRELKVLLIFVLMILYTYLCTVIGFFFASVLFSVAFLVLMGDKVWWHYAVAIVMCFIIFYCFRYLLYIHLPRVKVWLF